MESQPVGFVVSFLDDSCTLSSNPSLCVHKFNRLRLIRRVFFFFFGINVLSDLLLFHFGRSGVRNPNRVFNSDRAAPSELSFWPCGDNLGLCVMNQFPPAVMIPSTMALRRQLLNGLIRDCIPMIRDESIGGHKLKDIMAHLVEVNFEQMGHVSIQGPQPQKVILT